MKSKLLIGLVFFVYSFSVIGQTQYTSIPDSNFENALSAFDDIPNDNQVPTANISSLTFLDVGGMNISDLTGIEDFVSLTILGCYDNQLTSVDISNQTSLVYFYAYNNQFTSLNTNHNPSLTYLYCNNNLLTNIDVSLNPELQVLHTQFNQLSNIDVSQNPNLSVLRCGNNFLANIDLSQNLMLNEFLGDNNSFGSLDFSQHPNFSRLYCNSCNLSSLNVKNGNNSNIEDTWFRIKNNPDLTCVEVDDATFSTSNWFRIDEQTVFSENCGESLASEYVILAQDRVNLKFFNKVESGSIGVLADSGIANIKKFSAVMETVEAPVINVDYTSSVDTEILQPVDVDLPDFVYNNVSDLNSPNIVVHNNQTVTLNDSEYGEIHVKSGGKLIITNPNVYIGELIVQKNANLDFLQCTNLIVKDRVKFGRNTDFNPSENSVFVFVNGKVDVDRGCNIHASIYANNNNINVRAKILQPTQMKGLFIAKQIKGDNFVVWNKDEKLSPCSMPSASVAKIKDEVKGKSINSDIKVDKGAAMDDFVVNTWPIPTNNSFNVKVNSKDTNGLVSITVYDINGRKVLEDSFVPQGQYIFGGDLQSGVYIVKIMQSTNIKTIRVIKN